MKIIALFGIALGGLISLANWLTLYHSRRKKRFVSSVPLIGALCLGSGLAYFENTRPYALLSLVADYGTFALIISIPLMLKEAFNTSRFNLLKTFVGQSNNISYNLMLYKRGIFVIQSRVDPPQVANDHGAMVTSFGLTGKWEENEGIIVLREYAGDRALMLHPLGNDYISREVNYPRDNKYRYDSLDGVEFVASKA